MNFLITCFMRKAFDEMGGTVGVRTRATMHIPDAVPRGHVSKSCLPGADILLFTALLFTGNVPSSIVPAPGQS